VSPAVAAFAEFLVEKLGDVPALEIEGNGPPWC
jgi:hypothetical protein